MDKVPIKKRVLGALHYVNIPHHICDHIFSKQHSTTHRIFVGGLVALAGVFFTKLHLPFAGAHYLTEYFGFALHALGLVLVVDHIVKTSGGIE